MKLVLATHNLNKIREIKSILKDSAIEFLTLPSVAPKLRIKEKGKTLAANARYKALITMRKTHLPSLAEDTGLEVLALGKRPGVLSARYAGKNAKPAANVKKLLKQMEHLPARQRQARFRTVFALAIPNKTIRLFSGVCPGKIALEPKGKAGFGYDPIFIPKGYRKTFSEMSEKTKNRISHRAKALHKVKQFLKRFIKND